MLSNIIEYWQLFDETCKRLIFQKGMSILRRMFREKKAWVVFGVTDQYKIDICNIKYIVYKYCYEVICLIDIK